MKAVLARVFLHRATLYVRYVLATASLLFVAACSRAPTLNILGSFFPAWILCGVIGIVLTGVLRVLFVRLNFERELSPLIVVYPCLAALFTFSVWLVFFR
jgi:hypothetical protein